MAETGTTQEVIAEVVGCSRQNVSALLARGTFSLEHITALAQHPATVDCVRAFCQRVHARLDRRGPGRARELAELQARVVEAVADALTRMRRGA